MKKSNPRQTGLALSAFVFTAAAIAIASSPAAHALSVDLDALKGFSSTDKVKVGKAAATMSDVLSGEEFRQAILDFTYAGKNQFANNSLADATGNTVAHDLTNQQIYDTMMASRETYLNNTDEQAHLDLTLYSPAWYKKWSVVGYGYPGQPQIFMNWNYFNKYTVAQVAANIAHEWTHKLGFDHDYNRTAQRPYSVPYGVGCLVEAIASEGDVAACSQR